MRKSTTIINLSAIALFALAGCSKKTTGTTASMTATVGSHAFSATGSMVTASTSGSANFGVAGVTSTYESISITVDGFPVTTGTFPIGGSTLKAIAIYGPGPGSPLGVVHGSVTITSVSPNWTGTFYFTCSDSTKVTGGTFSIKAP